MTTIPKILSDLQWEDSDDAAWRSRLRGAQREEGDESEHAAFLSPGFQPADTSGTNTPRFMGEVLTGLAEQATARAGSHPHPYTASILLDFAAAGKPKSKENRKESRKAALSVADRYIDAVEHFSEDPLAHILAIRDATARAVELLSEYAGDASRLAAAAQQLAPRFLGTDSEEFIGGLATALSRGLRRAPGNLSAVHKSFREAVEQITDSRARARCALDLEPLARLAGELPGHKSWCAGLVGQASLERLDHVDALVSANELMGALRLASDAGHPMKDRILAALQDLQDPLAQSGTDIHLPLFSVDTNGLDSSANAIRSLSDLRYRLAGCGHIVVMPTAEERSSLSRVLHPGAIASLVSLVVIGEHGPTGEDPDSLADHMALEALIQTRAQIAHEVMSRLDPAELLPAGETATLFVDAGLIDPGQEPLFADAWSAWARGEHRLALFALFPFIEQAFRNICGRRLGQGRSGSVRFRVGDTVVKHVEKEFGEEVAAVFGHLLTREGARRHGFAHGYQKDEPDLEALAAYCIHLLCFAFAHRVAEPG